VGREDLPPSYVEDLSRIRKHHSVAEPLDATQSGTPDGEAIGDQIALARAG
jgi:hypothetical protein